MKFSKDFVYILQLDSSELCLFIAALKNYYASDECKKNTSLEVVSYSMIANLEKLLK